MVRKRVANFIRLTRLTDRVHTIPIRTIVGVVDFYWCFGVELGYYFYGQKLTDTTIKKQLVLCRRYYISRLPA